MKNKYGVKATCKVLELDNDMYYYYTNQTKVTPWYFEGEVLDIVQSISDSSIVNTNIGQYTELRKLQIVTMSVHSNKMVI